MLRENLINIYETSFRENYALPALTDYFKQENFTYLEMGAEIAKLHLLFDEAGIRQGDRIALIGRNNPRWCITYIATITYGAVIVPILQDFHANDVIHIINHSESRLLFLGDTFWDAIEADQIRKVDAVFSLTDLNAIYERRDPKKLTEFQKNRENHFRKAYPKGFGPEHIRFHKIPNERMILLDDSEFNVRAPPLRQPRLEQPADQLDGIAFTAQMRKQQQAGPLRQKRPQRLAGRDIVEVTVPPENALAAPAPETVLTAVSVVVCAMCLLSLAIVRQLLWRSVASMRSQARKCRKWAGGASVPEAGASCLSGHGF